MDMNTGAATETGTATETPETAAKGASGATETTAESRQGGDKAPDIDALVSEAAAKAVAAAREQWDKEAAEAAAVAKMRPDEAAEHALKKREDAVTAKEAELAAATLKMTAMKAFADKGLPPTLADCLNYAGEGAYKASFAAVEKTVREGIERGVNERLKTDVPGKGSSPTDGGFMAGWGEGGNK